MPNALESLTDRLEGMTEIQIASQKDTIDWSTVALLPRGTAETVEEVLSNREAVFPDLLKLMQTEREAKLIKGNRPSVLTVDICFTLDCSGSMSFWLSAAKQQIRVRDHLLMTSVLHVVLQNISTGISEKIRQEHVGLELEFRFGIVAYRDYGDSEPHIVFHPLSSNTTAFFSFLALLTASGGSDTPEDVLGALNTVANMEGWQSKVRFCVLIGDAPGHGAELNMYHNDKYVAAQTNQRSAVYEYRYPEGDPSGLTVKGVMTKLKLKNIHLLFCKIVNRTDRMISNFAEHYNDKGKFELTTRNVFGDILVS